MEHYNYFTKRRHDLLGVIDIIALDGGIVGIQTTSGANHAARRAKALAEPRLRQWIAAGGRFALWSWSKRGPAGKRKRWELRVEQITEEMFGGLP